MDILADLNQKQKQAVTHKSGPLLVVAGAGTGKTSVITRRIAYLISQKWVKPSEILALTFTDKAAGEMEVRVDELVPYGFVDMWVSTFHAFGDRVLRENAILAGLPPDFKVLTRSEQAIFVKENIFKFDLKHFRPLSNPTKYINSLLTLFSRLKDEEIYPEEFLKLAKKKLSGVKSSEKKEEAERLLEEAGAYKKYQEFLEQSGNLDFGDQILKTLKLFRERSGILKNYQEKFKYILVDEFQDTNFAQNELLKLLAGKDRNITVVADDDQSIYKFRGAAISNVLEFKENFPDAEIVVLTENYRSAQNILDYAYRLIQHNNPDRLEVKEKIDKKLKSSAGQGVSPQVLHFQTGSAESDKISEIILEKVKKKEYQFKDFAVLIRANSSAQDFIQTFSYKGIPYKFSGSSGAFQNKEARILLSFVRCLADPEDSLSLYHLATSDIYKIPPQKLVSLLASSKKIHRPLSETFANINENEKVDTKTKKSINKIVEDLTKYLKMTPNESAGQVVYKFLDQSGYLKKLTYKKNIEGDIALFNISKFFEKIMKFEHVSEDKSLIKFSEHLETIISSGEDASSSASTGGQIDPDLDAVSIMTIHSAKGLEFPVVFLVNLVNQKFPTRHIPDQLPLPDELIRETLPSSDWHLAEERRLFYVGMTRAKNELYLTFADDYNTSGGSLGKSGRARKISQFVLEASEQAKPESPKEDSPFSIIEKFKKNETNAEPINFYNGGELIISPSQIDDYLTCPQKFKYIHIIKIPLMEYHPLVYGTAIHKAIEAYFKKKMENQKVSFEEILEVFKTSWKNQGFVTREHEEQRLAQGEKTLKNFFENQEKEKRYPVLVEEKFTCEVPEAKAKIYGRFDAVYEDKNLAEIMDVKTSEISNQEKADKRVSESRQLDIYSLAWKEIKGKLPDKVSLYFIEAGILGSKKPSDKDLEKRIKEIKEISSGLKKHNFKATPGSYQCNFCPYHEYCEDAKLS